MRFSSISLLALLIVLFTTAAEASSQTQEKRFMDACLKTQKSKVCNCFYQGNATVLNEQQIELIIARMAKDKAREQQIKSNPNFDYAEYNRLAPKAVNHAAGCLLKPK